jgi:hypothetical protein
MTADASAYAALGLKPGADSAAIEQAYKRLIKQHHPDREGGDSKRAAELNRAYRELRSVRSLRDPLELNDEQAEPARQHGFWVTFALVLSVAAAALLLRQTPVANDPAHADRPLNALDRSRASQGRADPMDRPLNLGAIDKAVQEALKLHSNKDEMALASASRDCHQLLRTHPSLVQLDRCAAFDDAVVQLEDRDPLRDQGPFGELAVTGRVWNGATALSDDSVAIDGRLDRIRLQVELAIATQATPTLAKGN